MSLSRTNNVELIGRLTDVEVKNDEFKSNHHKYVEVNANVRSHINGKDMVFPVRFFSSETKADGSESKMYKSFLSIKPQLEGKTVRVIAGLSENRFYSSRDNQMHSALKLNGRFITGRPDTEPHKATFEVGGVLISSPVEKRTKIKNADGSVTDGEIYRYDVQLGQANYAENNMEVFTFNIRPTDIAIKKGFDDKIQVGTSIVLIGDLDFTEETVTKEDTSNVFFGEPIVKSYTRRTHNMFIRTVTGVAEGEEYPEDVLKSLIAAYKASDKEIEAKAKEKAANGNVAADDDAAESSAPKITSRQASLL